MKKSIYDLLNWTQSYFPNLLNKIKHLLSLPDRAEWVAITSALGGALIAAAVSLFVVYIQNNQQRSRDELQQKTAEQNKLRYLHFLINDSFKTIDFYRLSVENAKEAYKNNPFIIPNLNSYVPHSLNSIANKINQEEYYLASVNQFPKNGNETGVAELLQLCNSLNDNYTKSVSEFGIQFPLLIEDKGKYRSSLNELIESINQYLLKYNVDKASPKEKIIYEKINGIMGNVKNSQLNFKGNNWLQESYDLFLLPTNSLLEDQGEPTLRKLYNQSRNAITLRDSYIGRIYNVVNSLETNRLLQLDVITRIKKVGAPLDLYIKELNKEK